MATQPARETWAHASSAEGDYAKSYGHSDCWLINGRRILAFTCTWMISKVLMGTTRPNTTFSFSFSGANVPGKNNKTFYLQNYKIQGNCLKFEPTRQQGAFSDIHTSNRQTEDFYYWERFFALPLRGVCHSHINLQGPKCYIKLRNKTQNLYHIQK